MQARLLQPGMVITGWGGHELVVDVELVVNQVVFVTVPPAHGSIDVENLPDEMETRSRGVDESISMVEIDEVIFDGP